MEEGNMSSKSNNINQNLFLMSHKSVALNQINSTKIIPNILSMTNKKEDSNEINKESPKLKLSKDNQIVKTFSRKNPLIHSRTIKSPNALFGFFRNNIKHNSIMINNNENSKLNDTYNPKEKSPSNRTNHRNITSLFRDTMTPQNKMQIKRINSINVNEIKNNLLKSNIHNIKKDITYGRRNSLSRNLTKNFNFRNFFRKNTKILNPEEEDRKRLYLRTLYAKNYKKKPPKIVNPLQIPEEDLIFDEMKKYLCYKYESKRQKTFDNKKKEKDDKKNITKNLEFKIKKPKLKTADKIRLNYLYLATNKISNKIHIIKKRKSKKDLATYQKNLLEVIKPSITDYSYMYLRDRLFNIRKKNDKKYQTNYKKIKEIESEEKDIIYQFNETCENFMKTFKKEKASNSANYNNILKLPTLNFVSCLQKEKKENDKNQNKQKKKLRIKNLKKSKK